MIGSSSMARGLLHRLLACDLEYHFPEDGTSWFSTEDLATAYRIVISVAGCYIAARLAPDRPMGHALVLGVIGVVISAIGAAVTWNKGPAFGPHWYPLLLIVVAMPCAWIGGKLFTK